MWDSFLCERKEKVIIRHQEYFPFVDFSCTFLLFVLVTCHCFYHVMDSDLCLIYFFYSTVDKNVYPFQEKLVFTTGTRTRRKNGLDHFVSIQGDVARASLSQQHEIHLSSTDERQIRHIGYHSIAD